MPKVQKKLNKPPQVRKSNPIKEPGSDSKQARMIALMKRPEGATIDELIVLTGWMKHSVRGAISGALKKRVGLAIINAPELRGNVYRIKGGK